MGHAEEVASVAPSSTPRTGRAGSIQATRAAALIVPQSSSLEWKPSEEARTLGRKGAWGGTFKEGERAWSRGGSQRGDVGQWGDRSWGGLGLPGWPARATKQLLSRGKGQLRASYGWGLVVTGLGTP